MNATPTSQCPYCRSPLAAGASTTSCPACSTVHHADCWEENGGCAVIGCGGGRTADTAPVQPPEIVLPPIEDPVGEGVVVEVAAEPGWRRWLGSGRNSTIAAALAIAAMTTLGVVAAIVVRGADGGGEPPPPVFAETAAEASDQGEGGKTRRRGPRSFSIAQVERGAGSVLRRHHALLAEAAGDPSSPAARRAFALLSDRKRAAEEASAGAGQSGFEYWISKYDGNYENLRIGQAVCLPGTIEVRAPGFWRPQTGEAMVYVDFGSYAGFTWVLYENGRWTYDAGYGHVASREAEWKPQADILFKSTGVSC